ELQRYELSRLRQREARSRNVHDTALDLPLPGVGDREPLAVLPHQHAAIARLAAPEGIEDGSIELDAALVHREDACRGALEVGIFAEQKLGSHAVSPVYR